MKQSNETQPTRADDALTRLLEAAHATAKPGPTKEWLAAMLRGDAEEGKAGQE